MGFLNNLSIRFKQTLIIMLTSSVALLMACTAFIAYDVITFRHELISRVTILADAIGNNCVAAIDFGDHATAREALAGLRADDNIVAASVYTRDGSVFATYSLDESVPFVPPPYQFEAHTFTGDQLHLFRPVTQQGEIVGGIFVASSLNELSSRLISYIGIGILVLVASMLVALLLSNRLQRLLSNPILQLVNIARLVASEKNYSVRAIKQNNDELGQLVDGFNEMLEEIQNRDVALQRARNDLETRVVERTEELANANRKLQAVLNAATQISIIATDTKGLITVFNSGAEQMLGYNGEEVVGKLSPSILHLPSEISERGHELSKETGRTITGFDVLVDVAKRGEFDAREWTYLRRDGSRLTVNLVVTALRNSEGEVEGFLGVANDITQRKRVAEELLHAKNTAESATQLKSDFLANMSHEIRTPMNGILGMIEMLLDTELSEPQENFSRTVQQSAKALLNILDDILDFSKIEAGKLTIEKIDFNLKETIESIVQLLSELAKSKELQLEFSIAPEVPKFLIGDPHRLRQVLLNLTNNAIKFTQHGKVTIEVQVIGLMNGVHTLRFVVRDSGIGLSEEATKKLFQPFSQADTSTTRKFGGTGLGLAICRKLVELMDGSIGVESVTGKGSTFWFEIMLEESEHVEKTTGSATEKTPHEARSVGDRVIRVLLVEDNRINQMVATHQLFKLGYEVDVASDGLEALDAWQCGTYDIILMDCQMPRMDGFKATSKIRELERERSLTPIRIIAMTAAAMLGDRETCLAAGMDNYISKPVNIDTLGMLLSKISAEILKDSQSKV